MSAHPEEDSQRDDLQCDNSSSSSGSESPKHETDYIQLSASIRLFHHKMIDYRGNVFYGEKLSKVTGTFPLAIKLCPFNENIKKEARVLTKLRPHKHVVSIVHSDVYYQGPIKYMYIAMELCHEQDLHDHVTENKNNNVPFDPQLSISQAKQLVEGLNHIHSNDIIHRGLNPSNVLFSLDKKILKIADFGYSKPMTRGLSKTRVTTVGVGTDGYTAPETLISDEISKQADIFSLGLVFYFLWSNGHHAFGDDPDEWNRNIKKNRHRDLSHLCPILEDKGMITDLLDSMLQVNPKARPTVNQMLSHRIFDGIVQEQEEEMPYAPIDDIPSVEEVRDDGSDIFPVSDTIVIHKRKELYTRRPIFYGEEIREPAEPQPLAVKLITSLDAKHKKEADLMQSLQHANVVSCMQSGVYNNPGEIPYIYIAMELCHQQNLHDHVTESKNNNIPFDPQLSISQAKQLVEGLNHIHSNDIIHRDLKPSNVLLSLDKKTLKIGDFGISEQVTRGGSIPNNPDARIGTDGYRAPETYTSNEISKQTDIYSLGLVIYFLWSNGHHAFGDDPNDWNSNIKKNKDSDFRQLLFPDCEVAIDILQWMLQFTPQDRPTTLQILNHKIFGGSEAAPKMETLPKVAISPEARNLGLLSGHKDLTERIQLEPGQQEEMLPPAVVNEATLSQQPHSQQVQITGGEFVGAHFGPIHQHEHHQQVLVVHHYHPEQPTSSRQPGATISRRDQPQALETSTTPRDSVSLGHSIKLFIKHRISENIYRGEKTCGLTQRIQPLAIKFLHYKEERLREAKILTKLSPHHRVVSVIHSDKVDLGLLHMYIAMELCHTQDLHDHIMENKNNNVLFNSKLSISHAKQLVEGLNHIHSNDIIHRDLKPHNVLLSLDKKSLKIGDFGISKEMMNGLTMTFVTNARAGADGYRAPETYTSNEISKYTDIFSLGLVIYFLWSYGKHSFGEDSDDWNGNIKKNRNRDISQMLVSKKAKAEELVASMLQFLPRDRPTTSTILDNWI